MIAQQGPNDGWAELIVRKAENHSIFLTDFFSNESDEKKIIDMKVHTISFLFLKNDVLLIEYMRHT